jgi:phenylpyruvate tautomerase PptA (4-oxalocrotonate tautomerase family)
MPSYIVTCEEGRLTGSQKSQIAEAVTRAHGDSTGAPYYFAWITFNEVKPGSYFLGGTQHEDRMRLLYPRAMYGGSRRQRWFMQRESPSGTSQMSKVPVRGASTI